MENVSKQIQKTGRQLLQELSPEAYPLVIDAGHYVDLTRGPDAVATQTWEMGIALLDHLVGEGKGDSVQLSLLLNNLSLQDRGKRRDVIGSFTLPTSYSKTLEQFGFTTEYGQEFTVYGKQQGEYVRKITLKKNDVRMPLHLFWEGKLKNRGKILVETQRAKPFVLKNEQSESFATAGDGMPYIKLMLKESKPMCSLIMGTYFKLLSDKGAKTILCLYDPQWNNSIDRGLLVFERLFRDIGYVKGESRVRPLYALTKILAHGASSSCG